jgi:hypothetical protein
MARGQGPRLSRAQLLDIKLSAICSRNRYASDPAPVIDELRRVAGNRTDVLAQVAGSWSGYYGDEETQALAAALLTIEGADQWVELGRRRRGMPPHKTP